MEDEFKPFIEHQRRLNPQRKEVAKKEILKWLQARIIYVIFDSEWVSLVHVALKNGGINIVKNHNDEYISMHTTMEWRVHIDYHNLNKAIRTDILIRHAFYCFFYRYLRYN